MTQYSRRSTYDIIRVGLPITNDTVSQEFLDVVDELERNDKWVALTLCDYDTTNTIKRIDQHNAPAGYDILLDRGFKFAKNDLTGANKIIGTFGNLWGSRDPMITARNLMQIVRNFHERERFDTVVMFTPGSPYFDDAITKILCSVYTDMRVVDTKSSAQIAAEAIGGDCVVRAYYDDFVMGKNPTIDKSKIALFSCLQHGYNVDLKSVVTYLEPKEIITVSLSPSGVKQTRYTYDEFMNVIEAIFNSDETYTFGFVW